MAVITYVTCCNNLTTLPPHAALGCPTNGHVNEGGVLSLVAESNCPAVTTEVGGVGEDSIDQSRGETRGARERVDGFLFVSFRTQREGMDAALCSASSTTLLRQSPLPLRFP